MICMFLTSWMIHIYQKTDLCLLIISSLVSAFGNMSKKKKTEDAVSIPTLKVGSRSISEDQDEADVYY